MNKMKKLITSAVSDLTCGTGDLSFSYFFKSYFSFLKKFYFFLVALHLHCCMQALSFAVPGLLSSCVVLSCVCAQLCVLVVCVC